VIIEPGNDLTPLIGHRVLIDHGRGARVQTIHHGAQAQRCRSQLAGGVWGMCVYEPFHDLRGGASSFWWPYGTDLQITFVPAAGGVS
jgi:hypothetical protein